MGDLPLLKILIISGLTVGLFAVGLGIRWRDFVDLFREPGTAVVGIGLQWFALPVLAVAIVLIWPLPEAWILGIAILAASPGGPLSNLATYLGDGNGALSVSLTAFSTLMAPVTLPLLVALVLLLTDVGTQTLSLPYAVIIKKLVLSLLLPVVVGMLVRQFLPRVAEKLQTPLKWLASALFVVMFVHANVSYWERFSSSLTQLLPIAFILMAGVAAAAEWLGRSRRISPKNRMTLGLEVGIQNITTGLFLGEVVLKQAEITVFNLVYGALIPLFVATMIFAYRRINPDIEGNN